MEKHWETNSTGSRSIGSRDGKTHGNAKLGNGGQNLVPLCFPVPLSAAHSRGFQPHPTPGKAATPELVKEENLEILGVKNEGIFVKLKEHRSSGAGTLGMWKVMKSLGFTSGARIGAVHWHGETAWACWGVLGVGKQRSVPILKEKKGLWGYFRGELKGSRKGKAQFTPAAPHILTDFGSALPSVNNFPPELEICMNCELTPF